MIRTQKIIRSPLYMRTEVHVCSRNKGVISPSLRNSLKLNNLTILIILSLLIIMAPEQKESLFNFILSQKQPANNKVQFEANKIN